MKTAKQILSKYEREATFSDGYKIERVITISQDQVEQLENDIKWALRDIGQFDSNLKSLFEGDKLAVYQINTEFNKSDLIAIDAVIEYDVENAKYIIRKDTMIISFKEYHSGNYNIYKKGSVYED